MEINKLNQEFISKYYEKILELIIFNPITLEVSFNNKMLLKKKWIYGAINDNNFNTEEIENIIKNTKHVKKFICLNLRSILNFDIKKIGNAYIFSNKKDDWHEILSALNEYTLWESAIFAQDLSIFIIKPWSTGYNLLLAGEENIVKSICNDTEWLINDKYPIIPL